MGTSSNIGYKKDNEYHYVYSNFDGYLEGVGSTLASKYNSEALARALVEEGSMSYPGESYVSKGEDYKDNKPEITSDLDSIGAYGYIWDGKWLFNGYNTSGWVDLEKTLDLMEG